MLSASWDAPLRAREVLLLRQAEDLLQAHLQEGRRALGQVLQDPFPHLRRTGRPRCDRRPGARPTGPGFARPPPASGGPAAAGPRPPPPGAARDKAGPPPEGQVPALPESRQGRQVMGGDRGHGLGRIGFRGQEVALAVPFKVKDPVGEDPGVAQVPTDPGRARCPGPPR